MSEFVRVADIRAPFVDAAWPWADANASAIAENWERRRAATPKIFNGRVLMTSGLRIEAGRAEAPFFPVDYAALLAWTDAGWPDPTVFNGFGMGAIRTRDGAFILGEMAPHTANAGKLYFPCGTPDMSDVTPSGDVDLAGSLEREILEETGLGPELISVESGWTIVRAGGLLAFIRVVRLGLDAREARELILENLAAQDDPELSDVVIARSADSALNKRMPRVVPIFLRAVFAETASQR